MTKFTISQTRKWRVVSGVVGTTIFLMGASAFAQEPNEFSTTVVETTKRIVTSGTHSGIRWQRFPYYVDDLDGVYGPAGYSLFWFDGTSVTSKAGDMIAELAKAENDGLDPEDYDARMLAETLAAIERGKIKDPEQLALFDTALTIAFLRYVSDLHIGRVNPKNLHLGLDVQANKYDLATVLEQALADGHISALIANVQPVIPVYDRLKQILPKYRALAADPSLGPIPVVEPVVNPGDPYAGTPALAHLLVAVGDLSSADLPMTDPEIAVPVYEGAVVDGVKRFQIRHGLDSDGVIGPATFGALNTPMSKRLRSIEMGLERLRWLPFLGDEPFVIVDIPAFHLWAFDTGKLGDPDVTMNVIVGKAVTKTQTPIFSGRIKYLDFSPYWNVPFSITKSELLPKIRRDPGYLDAHELEIVAQFGNDEPALPPTQDNIDALANGRTNLRQRPGPKNALGMVKFIFPNAHNVYLHSTPAQQLFARTRRDFSHGCIRIEKPQAFAEWLLRDYSEWNVGSIAAAMDAEHPKRVMLQNPVPVYIFYTSAIVDLDGNALFYPDIYGHDEKLEQALEKGYPYDP
jgi:murein L,D-transpeptidase YcbB/YkuD